MPQLKIKNRPTATTNRDQTLQKLSGDWSTNGKIHDCFLMMMIMMITTMTMTADY
jgi:hypothetical protein